MPTSLYSLFFPFYNFQPDPSVLAPPLIPSSSAKYLGCVITPTSSSIPDALYRCSQASTAFKQLEPFFRHSLISPKKKLQIYSQIVLLHGSDSQVYSPAQVTRIDSKSSKSKALTAIESLILQTLIAQTSFSLTLRIKLSLRSNSPLSLTLAPNI